LFSPSQFVLPACVRQPQPFRRIDQRRGSAWHRAMPRTSPRAPLTKRLKAAERAGARDQLRRAPGAQSARTASSRRGKTARHPVSAEQRAHLSRRLDPKSVSYDALRDLVRSASLSRTPSVWSCGSGSDVPYRSFAEFIDYARKNPGRVRIGHPARGSVGDFCVQLINALTGVELVPIPYTGAAPPPPLYAEDTSKVSCWRLVP